MEKNQQPMLFRLLQPCCTWFLLVAFGLFMARGFDYHGSKVSTRRFCSKGCAEWFLFMYQAISRHPETCKTLKIGQMKLTEQHSSFRIITNFLNGSYGFGAAPQNYTKLILQTLPSLHRLLGAISVVIVWRFSCHDAAHAPDAQRSQEKCIKQLRSNHWWLKQ